MTAASTTMPESPLSMLTSVERLVANASGCRVDAGFSDQSPLGPYALKMRPLDGETESVANWLQGQSWVAALTQRRPNVYVRPTTEALRAWAINEPLLGAQPYRSAAERTVTLELGWVGRLPARSLTHFRIDCIANSLASVLKDSGYQVKSTWGERQGDGSDAASGRITVDLAAEDGASERTVRVGFVDVPHGPIRARHGGVVAAPDLLRELKSTVSHGPKGANDTVDPTVRARAVLALSLLRVACRQRIRLDDRTLSAEILSVTAVLDADRLACGLSKPIPSPVTAASDHAVRQLATQLLMLCRLVQRASREAEPAHLARAATSLASAMARVGGGLAADEGLRTAAHGALHQVVNLLGLADLLQRPSCEQVWGASTKDSTPFLKKELS